MGNLHVDLGGYFRLLFIVTMVENFIENRRDPMAIILDDAKLMAGCF